MDFHLDRRLRLNTDVGRTMYEWAINEVDDRGAVVVNDQIPWGWTLNFLATEVSVTDSLRYETKDGLGRDHPTMEIAHRSTIRAKLRPGTIREDKIWGREPTYSMFGTDRHISTFQLDIMAASGDHPEGCTAWGSVSYTSEIDFRTDTTDDTLQFYLMVPQATYERYVWNISQGMCDVMMLSVGHVDGFYSPWSPSISTDAIKVLAGSEHIVEGTVEGSLPRLGNIGKSDLTMSTKRVLIMAQADEQDQDDLSEGERRQGFRWLGKR